MNASPTKRSGFQYPSVAMESRGRHWLLAISLALRAVSLDVCFQDAWTEERCCQRETDWACWSNDLEDEYMRAACCLNEELPFDPPPVDEIRPDIEASISCRSSAKWSRFRRFLAAVIQDGALLTNSPRLLRLVAVNTLYILFGGDTELSTIVGENGSSLRVSGHLEECFVGYALALLVYVLVTSHECSAAYRGKDRSLCQTDEERSRLLEFAGRIHNDAVAGLALPQELVGGMLASGTWPLRRLHLTHFSEVSGQRTEGLTQNESCQLSFRWHPKCMSTGEFVLLSLF